MTSLRDLVAQDVAHYAAQSSAFQDDRPGLWRRLGILTNPAVSCVLLYRVSHRLHRAGLARCARGVAAANRIVHRVEIDPRCPIGPGLYIPHPSGVLFRGRAGRNLVLYANAIVGPRAPVPACGDTLAHCPVLGDDVTLAAAAMVLGPCRIGDGVRIGPPAVVTGPVADGSTVTLVQGWKVVPADPAAFAPPF